VRNLRRLSDITAVGGFFDSQVVAQLETATFLRTEIAAHKRVLGRHRHQVVQMYYVLEGQIDVEIGSSDCHAGTGELAVIPRGFSHMARNPGEEPAVLLEVFAPAPSPIEAAAELCDRDEHEPAGECLRTWDPAAPLEETGTGLGAAWLLDPDDPLADVAISVVRHQPGGPGVGPHVHDSDRVHVVLDGDLSGEVAGRSVTAGTQDLLIIPAGVPHSYGAGGQCPCTHLTLYLPGLSGATDQWGTPVHFARR
jgi:mannose-6-phosphate isomerase-like protein (cupin superfamily)